MNPINLMNPTNPITFAILHLPFNICHLTFAILLLPFYLSLIMNWYAIWTRYRHEDLVKMQLNEKNFEVFLPKIKTLSKRKDRRKIIEKPLFPGYLFTRTELNPKSYFKIIRCQGVVRVLGYREDCSAYIPDEVIESIMKMVQDEKHINIIPEVIKGDKVRIVGGPLDGCIGSVLELRGNRHLVVAVELLSRSVSVVLTSGTTVLPIGY